VLIVSVTPYYEHAGITIYHGDCRDVTAWASTDVLVTDPPYGIAWSAKKGGYKGKGSQVEVRHAIANDADTAARDWVLKKWGIRPAVVFGTWRAPRPSGTEHRLIWHKKGQAPGPANAPFMLQDEEIYIIGSGFRASSPPLRSVIITHEARSVEVAKIGHPTPKPIGLMCILIDRCPNGTIADPFMGSGSTLVAAKRLGRNAIGIEIEERYCEIAAKRLSQEVLPLDMGA
jgi:site-specific DNA-methyltransferase (adenine-specific)